MISRRAFAFSLIAAPALNSTARAQVRADVDVVIIGAGAAGLAATHAAREKGLSYRLIEARARVGGRVFTDASLGPAFDAGAFYIHFSERNPWREIATALKIETIDDANLWGGFDVFRDGKPLPMSERWQRRGAFGRLTAALESEGADVDLSFAEAARRHAPEFESAAGNLTLLSLGEDPERVSIRDYQRLDAGEDLVAPGGYGNLLEAYATPLAVELSTPATLIDWSGPHVRVETPRGTITTRRVVITVSAGVLQGGAIRFTPALPVRMADAISGLGMGALTKVALRFEGARFGLAPWTQYFDQGAGNRGDLVNFEFWPFGRDLVIAFFGGDYARGLAQAGEAEAVRVILARLVAILGQDAAKAFRGGRLAGWSADPLALGGYSIAKPGKAAARDVLAEPVAERLFLAGEASAGIASMTAGGAAIAGRRAIDVIARLK